MKETSALQEYLIEINDLINKLKLVGVKINEEDKIAIMFSLMLDSWG